MYKVFVNDVPIILSTEKEIGTQYTSIPIKKVKIKKLIKKVAKGELLYVNLYHKKEEKLLKHLKKKLKTIVAGGGLVYNPKGEILFIYRNDRWDLPKGKVDKGETIKDAAIREVEEETGVKKLKIDSLLKKTYHIFKRNGTYKLKETHWFLMTSKYKGTLVPQCNENIELAEWRPASDIPKLMENSYENIKTLF